MKLDAIVGTKIGGGHAHLHSDGKETGESTFRPKIIMPLADLKLGERLYSAATIRKWLEEDMSDAVMKCLGPPHWHQAEAYRAMIALKLKELEGGG